MDLDPWPYTKGEQELLSSTLTGTSRRDAARRRSAAYNGERVLFKERAHERSIVFHIAWHLAMRVSMPGRVRTFPLGEVPVSRRQAE
jgi:hypothetical protein